MLCELDVLSVCEKHLISYCIVENSFIYFPCLLPSQKFLLLFKFVFIAANWTAVRQKRNILGSILGLKQNTSTKRGLKISQNLISLQVVQAFRCIYWVFMSPYSQTASSINLQDRNFPLQLPWICSICLILNYCWIILLMHLDQ